jgi:hypothetical protein
MTCFPGELGPGRGKPSKKRLHRHPPASRGRHQERGARGWSPETQSLLDPTRHPLPPARPARPLRLHREVGWSRRREAWTLTVASGFQAPKDAHLQVAAN